MNANNCVFILYGSQTGNAESIAKDLHSSLVCQFPRCNAECLPLNAFKGFAKKENTTYLLLIICSTTGNGDSPENSDVWWRSIKLRSAAKDLFSSMKYSVLGLGDTNYDKFCFMGKSIDKRLSELGAERLVPLECADEVTNLEEVVERWKRRVEDIVSGFVSPLESTSAPNNAQISDTEVSSGNLPTKDISDRVLDDKSSDDTLSHHQSTDVFFDYSRVLIGNKYQIPTGLSSFVEVVHSCGFDNDVNTLIESYVPPPLRAKHETVNIEVLQESFTSPLILSGSEACMFSEYSAERPFIAEIVSARWLTDRNMSISFFDEDSARWGEGKRVISLDLSIAGSNFDYDPGDALGICCPNPDYAVRVVLKRLQEFHGASLTMDTVVLYQSNGKTVNLSVEELLMYRLDLCGFPKKAQLSRLAHCCQDPIEAKQLSLITGKDSLSRSLFSQFVEMQALNVADLLYLFPSCQPSLTQLAQILSPLPPRYYSLASSSLCQGEVVSVAISLVRYKCQVANTTLNPVLRRGVCSAFLEEMVAPFLYDCQSSLAKPKVRIFHKSAPHFHLPGSQATPLVLVGPGTGVSPFIGFLQHRSAQLRDRYQRLHPCHSSSDKLFDLGKSGRALASPSKAEVTEIQRVQKRKTVAVSELMSEGVWRGGFELDSEDLPCEGNGVESFLDRVPCGAITLFFGCRDTTDFLFEKELRCFVEDSVLSSLYVAFSRVPSQPKEYVTHQLKLHGEEVCRMIMEQQAAVYICGDGTSMARDVMQTLEECLVLFGYFEDREAAQLHLATMKTRKRLNLDIWS